MLVSVSAAAQGNASRKGAEIPRLSVPPVLDGRLDDAAWRTATRVDDLEVYSPVPGAAASYQTVFYLAYDDEALYIAARLEDPEPERILRNQLLQNQQVVNDDHVQIMLDPHDTKRGGYLFYVNPNGVQRDGLTFGNFRFNMDWDGIWYAQAVIDEGGWSAEIALPFKTLSFDPSRDSWGINLIRNHRRSGEEVAWSYRDAFPTVDVMAEIRGLDGLEAGRGLDVVPSLTLRERKSFAAGSSDTEFEPSLDVFYRLTPGLTSVLTVNTDFSATEVDDRQVNLTRFSLFFPEKRDFFLQDTDIFEFAELAENGRPFFSRTIGLGPGGETVDLVGGLKIAGREGPWSIGALAVRQDELGGVAPQDLAVARIYRQVLGESTLGGVVTYGDPSGRTNNWLAGADFNFRNTRWIPGRSVESQLWYQRSDTSGLADDQEAFGVKLLYPNDRLNLTIGFSEIQEKFRPAMGFVNRSGIRRYDATAFYRKRFAKGWVNALRFGFEGYEIDDTSNQLESRFLQYNLAELTARPGDRVTLYGQRRTEVLREPFNILGRASVPAGRYDFDRFGITAEAPAFRRLGARVTLESGDFFDGSRDDLSMTLFFRPTRHFVADLSYSTSDVQLATERFITRIYSLRANVAFNVRWAWINFVQYDNVSERLGFNTRLRWIPKQGQELFFVVNYDMLDEAGSFSSELRDTTLKFNYTFRY